jgi:hypothetical protein
MPSRVWLERSRTSDSRKTQTPGRAPGAAEAENWRCPLLLKPGDLLKGLHQCVSVVLAVYSIEMGEYPGRNP